MRHANEMKHFSRFSFKLAAFALLFPTFQKELRHFGDKEARERAAGNSWDAEQELKVTDDNSFVSMLVGLTLREYIRQCKAYMITIEMWEISWST